MTNAVIVREHKRLTRYRRELAAARRQATRLEKTIQQLDSKVQVLDMVTEIIDGVALRVTRGKSRYGLFYEVNAVDDNITRRAEVYTNAHTRKDCCIRIWRTIYEEKWLGDSWRYVDAVAVAQRFVTRGQLPEQTTIEMYQALGARDPRGRLGAQEARAFKAAWLGGYRELADTILHEATR